MELRDYLRTIAKRWKIVALLVIVCLSAGVAMTVLTTPTYQASTQLFVSVKSDTTTGSDLFQGSSFTTQRVKSYTAIASSPQVTRSVVDRLDLPITPEALASQIEADAPLDTVLINLRVTDTSPVRAARIANAAATEFVGVVQELERPSDATASPVKLTVTERAQAPLEPISPRPLINTAFGLLVGLALGVGVAVLRETLDVTVKTSDDLEEAAGAAVLGAVIFDPGASKAGGLVTGAQSRSLRGEAYRRLRTNMQFVDVDEHPCTVVITSPLAGEGKSTTAGNLALALAHAGRRVCLVDADMRRPTVAESTGLVGDVGLTTVLIGQASLDDVVQDGPEGLPVITSGPIPPNPSELLGSHHMGEVLKLLSERYDMVIIDVPPLLPVTDAAVLAAQADGAVLVVRANKTTRQQVERAANALAVVDAKLLGTVLNMAPPRGREAFAYGYGYSYRAEPVSRKRERKQRRVHHETAKTQSDS